MKSKIQPVIIILGLFSLVIGARQMLDIPTMILPSWFLLLTSLPCIFGGSFVLGYLTKKMMNSKWRTITFASVFITAFCSIYYISQYKITYNITIPENYAGEVRLFVSNEKGNDFLINHYGVGYINQETFSKGFYPKIIKGNQDITAQVKEYSKGALTTTLNDIYSYEYLSFSIPPDGGNVEDQNVEELLKIRAIDTVRLFRRSN